MRANWKGGFSAACGVHAGLRAGAAVSGSSGGKDPIE
uniref:Uncharacterized protein n=1 Tax=Arundo donax TaxID=35708 RepID=A0A0A9C8I7_ARUDO